MKASQNHKIKCQKIEHQSVNHGHMRVDHYHWLRDENWRKILDGDLDFANPKIPEFLAECNQQTDAVMADYRTVEDKLYREILSRTKEDRVSYPFKKAVHYYYSRDLPGKDYPQLCRSRQAPPVKAESEEVYFDVNEYAKGHHYFSVQQKEVSRQGRYFAYVVNTSGSLEGNLRVKDLQTLHDLDIDIPSLTGDFKWVSDHELIYIERDADAPRGKKLFYLDVSAGMTSRKLLFVKPDQYDHMYMWLSHTTDRAYYTLELTSGASQVLYLAKGVDGGFEKFFENHQHITCTLEHYQGTFYLSSNRDNPAFQIYSLNADSWQENTWQLFYKNPDNNNIKQFAIYSDYLLLLEQNLDACLPETKVINLMTENLQTIAFPYQVYELFLRGAWDHRSSCIQFEVDLPHSPLQNIELNLETCQIKHLATEEVPGFDPDNYQSQRVFATAADGEQIPLTLIHKKDLVLDGSSPALVYGYGAYGISQDLYFDPAKFSLIDRGFVYCIAHVRGGGDKGKPWYLAGKMHNKMNTFTDIIDSCHYLSQAGYCSAGNITLSGGSAGGLLVAAVVNMQPQLFKAAVANVAFVDVVSTMLDAELPLTPPEWDEWGNPIESEQDYHYMLRYSPYDNVQAQNYPAMLFTSGVSDEQVTYWEPAKMVAKLNDFNTSDQPILLNMKMTSGHGGSSEKYQAIREDAFRLSFILKMFKIK